MRSSSLFPGLFQAISSFQVMYLQSLSLRTATGLHNPATPPDKTAPIEHATNYL